MFNEKGGVVVLATVLVALNIFGSFVLYQKISQSNAQSAQQIELLRQQILATSQRPSAPVKPVTPQTAPSDGMDAGLVEYKPYTGWDLKFSYPETFSVAKYEDEFQSGQTNIRLTSKPGKLFLSAGGPARPGRDEFTLGYEMTIAKFIPGQDPVGDTPLAATSNPLVKEIKFVRDGVGYDLAQYIVKTRKGSYLIRVNANDYEWSATDTEGIINTIRE